MNNNEISKELDEIFNGKRICKRKDIVKYMSDAKESWSDGKERMSETEFVRVFKDITKLIYVDKMFYDINGFVSKSELRHIINDIVEKVISNSTNSKVRNIMNALENKCYLQKFKPFDNEVTTISNTLFYKERKWNIIEKQISINTLNVEYLLNDTNERPTKWLKTINEMFDEKSALIFQEYLGYCLMPHLRAQKSLFIIGDGNNGKSTIMKVVNNIFGPNVHCEHLHSLFNDKFAMANVANKLIIYDDELKKEKLEETDIFKQLISGGLTQAEKKYEDKFEIEPYAKIIACGNHMINANVVDTYSFKRRLIVLNTKSVPKNRVTNTRLYEELLDEKELIFLWILEGYKRLFDNDFKFSYEDFIFENVEDNLDNKIENPNTFEFLRNMIILDNNSELLSRDILNAYKLWCDENNENPNKDKIFYSQLKNFCGNFGLIPRDIRTNNEKGKGYKGINFVNKN